MRAGGERRGNARDRKRRREWLLRTFDPELGPEEACCRLQLADDCRLTVDRWTLTVDRIEPGGSYARDNIQPACGPCQNKQGALITNTRRIEWQQLADEAAARGIEWDGQLA